MEGVPDKERQPEFYMETTRTTRIGTDTHHETINTITTIGTTTLSTPNTINIQANIRQDLPPDIDFRDRHSYSPTVSPDTVRRYESAICDLAGHGSEKEDYPVVDYESDLRTNMSTTPHPEPPRGRITPPRRHLSLSPAPAASSRLSLLARARAGRAVAFPDITAASSPPACPPFRVRPPEARPRRQPVALSPPTASSRPCRAAQVQAGHAVSSLGITASTSTPACPRFRPETAVARAGLSILVVADVPSAAPSSSPACRLAASPPPPASQRQGRPRPRLPSTQTPPVSVVVFTAHPRRLVVSWRRLRRRHRSGVFHAILVFVQPLPVVIFVLGSASSSLVPAVSRLRSRIAAEVVPSPFASVVPEPSPFPRLVAWCFACVLRVASVVPEVPEAWFVVVAEGSEGRCL
uniref:Uncharacterized protein n=1 Tax=Oryza sativa subsp. japonica TaxID=39947 RepID=Q8H3U2_ORYSJ|nr:hypothetical protein [Oryza sativa Japonica Group]